MRKNIVYFLQKLGFLYILKLEESYFKSVDFKKNKKPPKDVIWLNYQDLSPFENTQIFSTLNGGKLFLWFAEKDIKESLVIPESYLLAKFLIHENIIENQEGIVVYNTEPKKIIVLKNGILQAEFSKKQISSYELELLKKEFGIVNVYSFSTELFQQHIEASYENISIEEIFSFISFDLNYKEIFKIILDKFIIPFSLVISTLFLIQGINYIVVQDKISSMENTYKTIRMKSSTLRDELTEIDDSLLLYTKLQSELEVNQKYFDSIDATSKILQDTNSTLLFLRATENNFRVRIDTNETSHLFEMFIKTNLFGNLRIQNSKKNKRTNRELIIIQGLYK